MSLQRIWTPYLVLSGWKGRASADPRARRRGERCWPAAEAVELLTPPPWEAHASVCSPRHQARQLFPARWAGVACSLLDFDRQGGSGQPQSQPVLQATDRRRPPSLPLRRPGAVRSPPGATDRGPTYALAPLVELLSGSSPDGDDTCAMACALDREHTALAGSTSATTRGQPPSRSRSVETASDGSGVLARVARRLRCGAGGGEGKTIMRPPRAPSNAVGRDVARRGGGRERQHGQYLTFSAARSPSDQADRSPRPSGSDSTPRAGTPRRRQGRERRRVERRPEPAAVRRVPLTPRRGSSPDPARSAAARSRARARAPRTRTRRARQRWRDLPRPPPEPGWGVVAVVLVGLGVGFRSRLVARAEVPAWRRQRAPIRPARVWSSAAAAARSATDQLARRRARPSRCRAPRRQRARTGVTPPAEPARQAASALAATATESPATTAGVSSATRRSPPPTIARRAARSTASALRRWSGVSSSVAQPPTRTASTPMPHRPRAVLARAGRCVATSADDCAKSLLQADRRMRPAKRQVPPGAHHRLHQISGVQGAGHVHGARQCLLGYDRRRLPGFEDLQPVRQLPQQRQPVCALSLPSRMARNPPAAGRPTVFRARPVRARTRIAPWAMRGCSVSSSW